MNESRGYQYNGIDVGIIISLEAQRLNHKFNVLKERVASNKTGLDYLARSAVGVGNAGAYVVDGIFRVPAFLLRGGYKLAEGAGKLAVGLAPTLLNAYLANLQSKAQQAQQNRQNQQTPPPVPPQAEGPASSIPFAGSASAYASECSNYTVPSQVQSPSASATSSTGPTTINNNLSQPQSSAQSISQTSSPSPIQSTSQIISGYDYSNRRSRKVYSSASESKPKEGERETTFPPIPTNGPIAAYNWINPSNKSSSASESLSTKLNRFYNDSLGLFSAVYKGTKMSIQNEMNANKKLKMGRLEQALTSQYTYKPMIQKVDWFYK